MSEEFFDKYKNAVQLILLDFQWIEELLKITVSSSYEAIRRSAPPGIRFRPNRKNIEKDSLGRLVRKYEEVTANESLVAELHKIVNERNFCAHQSFVLSLEEQQDIGFLEKETTRLEAVRGRSRACVMALQEELRFILELLNETPIIAVERDAPDERSTL
ncbi:MAG: hypothetical protein ACYC7L_04565 [Nitrospirota bacterium]